MTESFLFDIPQSIEDYLVVLDEFIEREIKPLEARDDNIRFFDHRREHARTDWDRDGLPREEWEALLREWAASVKPKHQPSSPCRSGSIQRCF